MNELIKYIILAYVGMLIHMFTKLAEESKKPGFTLGGFFKDNIYHTLGTLLSIPVLIYMIHDDPLVQSYIPLTTVTSVFAGWQTQSMFKSIMNLAKPKKME